MQTGSTKGRNRSVLGKLLGGVAGVLLTMSAQALVPMSDDQMSEVQGTGLALAFDDFSFFFAPTSYIELTGSEPSGAAATAGWRRGDVRYYGFSISGGGAAGTDWYGDGCTSPDDLCPIGNTGASAFAPVNNPYVLRAFQIDGYNPSGTFLSKGNGLVPTHMEFVGPTNSNDWRWSFWGEIEVDRNGNYGTPGLLQSQTIIKGSNHTTSGDPSVFRIFQTEESTPTLGFTYQSALSGDFRFSVAQTSNSPNLLHEPPNFTDGEGLHFKNVDAFFPMGTLHYQFFTLNSTPANDGNFVIDLSPIPDAANAYNDFYCGNAGGCATNFFTADFFGVGQTVISSPNPETHGYVRWGDTAGATYGVGGTGTGNGIFFRQPAASGGVVNNIGWAALEGVLIQSLKLTTLGI